jgi:hypothetical protein
MKNILLALLIATISPLTVLATQEVTVSELFARSEVKAAEIEELENKEQERLIALENQLGFSLPTYTDNPSYVITFSDPSPDKKGVQLEIDGKPYIEITSPYTLPALSIGQHILKFRFYDKDGNVQILEYELIVLPRSPIIKPPVFNDTSITLSGTGLANSEIIVFLNSNTFNHSEIVKSNNNGEWQLNITPEEGLVEGIYSATAYTRKYGYASDLSTPVVFEIGATTSPVNTVNNEIFFSFASIDGRNIGTVIGQNTDLIFLALIPFVLGVVIALVVNAAKRSKKDEKYEKSAEAVIKVQTKNGNQTLRELFESNSKKEIKPSIEESKSSKPKERVISKEDFLKDYKKIDPDSKEGKEKPVTKEKKSVKVTLTS